MQHKKNIALITGANKGLGFETAPELGKAGWTVLLGARNAELGRAAESKLRAEKVDARFVELDVTEHKTITSAADTIRAELGRLDALINNAGIIDKQDGPPSGASPEVIERILRTNFTGTIKVTQTMLPLLKKSGKGRIVNVSGGLGSITLHGDPNWEYAPFKLIGYCASKAALNMFTVQLAFELKAHGIAVNSVNPGYTATDLNANQGHQTVAEGAAEIVRVALQETSETGRFYETGGALPWQGKI
ncbi:MAG TPA: SDR family oxidoreductase [Verrucomicrobiae bacterium]|nr:SDR family oxidoreductase [Verrucomicrobiae bacterium]